MAPSARHFEPAQGVNRVRIGSTVVTADGVAVTDAKLADRLAAHPHVTEKTKTAKKTGAAS